MNGSRKSYSEKLKDPRWQQRRLKIMERDAFTCQMCSSKEKTLNVHHAYYIRGREPWDYDDSMLITYCEDCHEIVETLKQRVSMAICSGDHKTLAIHCLIRIFESEKIPDKSMVILLNAIAVHGSGISDPITNMISFFVKKLNESERRVEFLVSKIKQQPTHDDQQQNTNTPQTVH